MTVPGSGWEPGNGGRWNDPFEMRSDRPLNNRDNASRRPLLVRRDGIARAGTRVADCHSAFGKCVASTVSDGGQCTETAIDDRTDDKGDDTGSRELNYRGATDRSGRSTAEKDTDTRGFRADLHGAEPIRW